MIDGVGFTGVVMVVVVDVFVVVVVVVVFVVHDFRMYLSVH